MNKPNKLKDKRDKIMIKAICSKKDLSDGVYFDCVRDIIDAPEIERLKDITHHISTTRYQHCVNVSYYGFIICRKLRLDARSAARAGLMHDMFYYDRREFNSAREKGQLRHSAKHSFIASENAALITDISDKEKDMIEKHMWPMTRPRPSYKETYIITFVDKYCAVLEYCIPKVKRFVSKNK